MLETFQYWSLICFSLWFPLVGWSVSWSVGVISSCYIINRHGIYTSNAPIGGLFFFLEYWYWSRKLFGASCTESRSRRHHKRQWEALKMQCQLDVVVKDLRQTRGIHNFNFSNRETMWPLNFCCPIFPNPCHAPMNLNFTNNGQGQCFH